MTDAPDMEPTALKALFECLHHANPTDESQWHVKPGMHNAFSKAISVLAARSAPEAGGKSISQWVRETIDQASSEPPKPDTPLARDIHEIVDAVEAWRKSQRSVPEAGKAVDFADGIPFDLVDKVENRIAYRISLGSTPRAIAEDVLQLACASPQPVAPTGEIAGLVERLNSLVDCGCLEDGAAIREAAAAPTASEAEATSLRAIISECAKALGNGAYIAPTCTVEFMQNLPQEIRLVVADLRRKLEEHRRVLAEARERINRYADTAAEHDLVARIDALAAPLPEDTHHGR